MVEIDGKKIAITIALSAYLSVFKDKKESPECIPQDWYGLPDDMKIKILNEAISRKCLIAETDSYRETEPSYDLVEKFDLGSIDPKNTF